MNKMKVLRFTRLSRGKRFEWAADRQKAGKGRDENEAMLIVNGSKARNSERAERGKLGQLAPEEWRELVPE